MRAVVIFERVRVSDFKFDREKLRSGLRRIGCAHGFETDNSCGEIRIMEGVLPNTPEKEKIKILISADKMLTNMGKYIHAFKKDAIDFFCQLGVPIDEDSFSVLTVTSYYIDEMIDFFENKRRKDLSMDSEPVNEYDYEQKSKQYIPVEPLYSFDRVVLPDDVLEKIEEAVAILECENKVFNEWGLYEIQPHPSTALSFYGPPGTGKTMAAEAVASKLGKKILKVSYADVESKYHGEGPKMVKAIFLSAINNDAVLFFDEADSLLSKRLTSVSQGSEQAINSMRSQLLICLEEFRGIVIFATNLVVNYDKAFLTRLISVGFKEPDINTRKRIWDVHIKPLNDGRQHQLRIPLAKDVDTSYLAQKYEFAGREIRNAVVSACVSAALAKNTVVAQSDFIRACDKIASEKEDLLNAKESFKSSDILKNALAEKVKNTKGED